MISIENFGYLVSSTSQQNRQQLTMSTKDAQALLNDIVVLQNKIIHAQEIAINALQQANAPVSGNMEVDSGKF